MQKIHYISHISTNLLWRVHIFLSIALRSTYSTPFTPSLSIYLWIMIFSTFFIFGNGASRFFKHFFLRILHQIFNSLLSWSRFPTCYCYNRAEVFDKAIAKLVQQYLESRSVRVLENKKAVAGINVRNYNGKCWNITHSTIRTHMGKNIPF